MKSTENKKEPNITRDDKGRFCSKGDEDTKKQKKKKKDFLIMSILTFWKKTKKVFDFNFKFVFNWDMKYEVEVLFPMTVEFEIPDGDNPSSTIVRAAARAQATSILAEMDHYERINWVPKIDTIKEDV